MNLYSTPDICRAVASAARLQRLRLNLSRASLAKRSGVAEGSIVRFERTGAISLKSLVDIAVALAAEDDFFRLFQAPATPSIDALQSRATRKRGRA